MGGPIPADSGEGRGHPGQPVQVKVAGLRSKQLVTMRARSTDDKGVMFSSSATYRADGSGQIHLDRDPSLSGSYVGVEPMGLLWSMKPDTLHTCFRKTHLQMPHIVTLSVHDKEDNRMLAEVTNKRYLIGDGVSRIPKKEGNICVFATRLVTLLSVFFMTSLLFEKRACLLANKGFVVLSIMHLDHFEEAVNFLKWHSKVGSKGIGVISRSKGGDIALSIAAFVSGFEAVVCIGCNANVFFPLYYNKRLLLQPILSCYKKLISSVSGTVNDKYILDNHLEENNDALIPTELAKGQFLFVASEDDLSWDSKTYMDQMVERLKPLSPWSMKIPGSNPMLTLIDYSKLPVDVNVSVIVCLSCITADPTNTHNKNQNTTLLFLLPFFMR
uniref:Acyl-CoA thioester hydrolase/bile acid-CoA amino acid N-acetyltransferase domain-containing protein n=1 Tax=Acanthochromis polyacanthus TaxID=80966 RepID=A0A3Q1G5H9_9TELE